MSGSFYYFISSLPEIRLGEKPLVSSSEFLSSCEEQLSLDQFQLISELGTLPKSAYDQRSDLLGKWNQYDTSLRNAIVKLRAGKYNTDPQAFLAEEIEVFGNIDNQVLEAQKRGPLLGEEHLDQLRWQFLDNLLVGHQFDFDVLVAYRLKLLIAEKYSFVIPEEGHKAFNQLLEAQLDSDLLRECLNA
ncbi:MAG: DUF2764 family protein [Planctomycetes bacterium]|nr:DUF2764 family protein [Planctomycetota bacterium]